MKHKISLDVSTLLFATTFASAQVDKATGTISNDATQARLRVNNCVFNGPTIDIFVDGAVAENGGVPQTNLGFDTNGYLFLEPGTHSVAVAPTGKGLVQALVGPLDVSLSAGHRYTFVVMGQADEASHEALVIDETAAYQALGATPSDTPHITVNNLRGAAGVTFELDGVIREDNVPYGEFRAAFWPTGTFTGLDLTLRDSDNEVLVSDGFTGEGWGGPGDDWLDCVGGVVGTVSEDWFNRTSPVNNTLSVLEYLETFSSIEGAPFSFNTFLSAVETSGLTDVLTNDNPYFVLVPTDDAFAVLPKDQWDALLADPEALGDVLRNHIIEGYVPRGSLAKTYGGPVDRSFTNLLGGTTHIGEGFTVNGLEVGDNDSNFIANGTRLRPINRVLLPPSR